MLIFVQGLSGVVTPVNVKPFDTVLSVKYLLFYLKGIPVSQQHLLYDGIELPDSTVFILAKIGHGALLRLVLGLQSGPLIRDVRLGTRASTCHKSSPTVCPIPVSHFTTAAHRGPTMMWSLCCAAALQQQGKRHTMPLVSVPRLVRTGCTSQLDQSTPEDEVSQLAEILGYAIDETELAIQSDPTCPERANGWPTIYRPSGSPQMDLRRTSIYGIIPWMFSAAPQLNWVMDENNALEIVLFQSDYPPLMQVDHSTDINPIILSSEELPRIDTSADDQSTFQLSDSTLETKACSTDSTDSSKSEFIIRSTECDEVDRSKYATDTTSTSMALTDNSNPTGDQTTRIHHKRWMAPSSMTMFLSKATPVPSFGPIPVLDLTPNNFTPVAASSVIFNPRDALSSESVQRPSHHMLACSTRHSDRTHIAHLPPFMLPCRLPRSDCESTQSARVTVVSLCCPSTCERVTVSEPSRCSTCHKRTRPARGFSCRCERWFCSKHHHPEDHGCDFDFKTLIMDPSGLLNKR
ncbi:hypothetical protein EG68_02200 [Paragonimus skrjabini miyazakii]|uniref:Ubiquitin-like domain-containing protein n=1 Tax=Paragonimus skrjabini miyazakii TaxID=59628 RepID=A0A8S9YZC9_9TREM|nr:hypothetical protein EG68_02200 [Paragonimus skrjabini miyazakii]